MEENIKELESKKPAGLRTNLPAKAVASLLFALCVTWAVMSGVALVVYAELTNFGADGNFYETVADNFIWRDVSALLWGRYGLIADSSIEFDEYGNYSEVYPDEVVLKDNAKYHNFVNFLYVFKEIERGGREKTLVQNSDGETAVFITSQSYSFAGRDFRLDCYLRYPMLEGDNYYTLHRVYGSIESNTALFVFSFVLALAATIGCFAFLLLGAGRKAKTPGVTLSWLDKVPLDILTVLIGLSDVGLGAIVVWVGYEFIKRSHLFFVVFACCFALAAFLTLHLVLSLARQMKKSGAWRNTLIFMLLRPLKKLVLFLLRYVKKIMLFFLNPLKKAVTFICSNVMEAVRSVPLIWKSALSASAALFICAFFAVQANYSSAAFFFLAVTFALTVFIVCVVTIQMRKLQKGGEALASGDVNYRVDTTQMFYDFKKHGENLNSISQGIARAVEERIKSERFKTDLITNVSHDIKTPLTSIINYVDLLKKENLEGEKVKEYIEVLDRQSERLRKLTEDVVEASKASSGAVAVSLSETDVAELLRQAVGEYEEKLERAGIEPVISTPMEPVIIMADGRLLWRVFDNLLSNICKYSLGGTRAYFSVDRNGGRVEIMFRNVSKDMLNITSDELMERFVRGDSSRSGEGSGLGLSIAKSFVDIQRGSFELFIDGDLFKVSIKF